MSNAYNENKQDFMSCSMFIDEKYINKNNITQPIKINANYSNYSASKGGQISFTKALASELCPKIRVNAVAPGWIETSMVRDVFADVDYKKSVLKSIPLNRMATTDDVALSICFLLSDWAKQITGEILNVNGGSVLCG